MAVKNEIGNVYERLTVIERAENNHRGDAQWLCRCECGNEVIVKGISLRSGHTRSCGCLQKDKVRQQGLKNTADLLEKRFGRLVVKERLVGNKDKIGKWRCICDCGGETITTSEKLLSGHTQSCGCLQSRGEEAIAKFLLSKNITFSKEYSFSDLKRKNRLRFDFAIFENNKLQCLIEFDGVQHFNKNNGFYNEEIVENDKAKDAYCLENNIRLFRIKYNENIEERMEEIMKAVEPTVDIVERIIPVYNYKATS
jgi:very-short-patch-repair endonuclease